MYIQHMKIPKTERVVQELASKRKNRPYPQLLHKIKMAQRVWVVCTGNLWRELHFEMKNAGFYSGEAY